MSLSLSLEEVLHVRASLLSAKETEAVFLQFLYSLVFNKRNDDRLRLKDEALHAKHVLLNAAGQVYLRHPNRAVAIPQLAKSFLRFSADGTGLLMDFSTSVSIEAEEAIQILERKIHRSEAARISTSLYSEVLGSCHQLNHQVEIRRDSGEGYSTEDSAISSDNLSRHPSCDSLIQHQEPSPKPEAETTPTHDFVFRRRRPVRIARARSTLEQGLKNWELRGNLVQRAPSRLYKLNEASITEHPNRPRRSISFQGFTMALEQEEKSCSGPEFIVKSSLPAHFISVCSNPKKKKTIFVLLLDGRQMEVECDVSKMKISQLFQIVIDFLHILPDDAPFYGLSTLKNGQFVFPRSDEKVISLAPDQYNCLPFQSFNVYFRFKFYVMAPEIFRQIESEHMLYLQLRKDVLEQRWIMDHTKEMNLASYALLIELGRYNRKVHGGGSYFHIDHYLSNVTQRRTNGPIHAAKALERLHEQLPVLERREAELNFIRGVMDTPLYGFRHIHVIEDDGLRTTPLNLLVGLQGLKLTSHSANSFDRTTSDIHINWEDVKHVTHSKHHVSLTLHGKSNQKKYKFCVGTSRCKETYDLLASHHKLIRDMKSRLVIHRKISSSKNMPAIIESPPIKEDKQANVPEPVSFPILPVSSSNNAVRIYVPFGQPKSFGMNTQHDVADVTTRLIEINGHPVKELNGDCKQELKETLIRSKDDIVVSENKISESSPLHKRTDSSIHSLQNSPRKSTLVRMGTKISTDALFREKLRIQEINSVGDLLHDVEHSGAYVLDASVKSQDESFVIDAHESISQSLAERFEQLPCLPSPPIQREVTVRFSKDRNGSLGILIARGIQGGIYLMGLTPNGPAEIQTNLKPGDRIVSVNGVDCHDMEYSEVVEFLRQIPSHIEMCVLQQQPN